jgi:heme exporter protein B
MNIFFTVVWRDLRLAMRRKAEVLNSVFFFVVVAALFPLAIGPEPEMLRQIGPGVLWVGALLATMLGLSRMFEGDLRDGSLEHMLLSPHSLGLMVLGKITAHWLLCGVPLVILAPILGLQFDLSPQALSMLSLSLLLGTPVLSCVGAIGAALTLGVRGGGILISLLVLPLFVPVLVFGAGAVQALESGVGAQAHVSILLAMLLPALFFSPWACSVGLRIALE